MREEEKKRAVSLVNDELDTMDDNTVSFHPIRERFEIIESLQLPGAIVVALLRASEGEINSRTPEWCLGFFGYLPQLNLVKLVTYLPVDSLEEAEEIIDHYQMVAAKEREEERSYGFAETLD